MVDFDITFILGQFCLTAEIAKLEANKWLQSYFVNSKIYRNDSSSLTIGQEKK